MARWLASILSKKLRSAPSETPVLGRVVGRGAYATCFLCEFQGRECVAKVVRKKRDDPLLRNEIRIWKTLHHPNVCELLAVFDTAERVTFVCERLGETLRARHVRMLRLGAKPRMHTLLRGWSDIASALAYLHGLHIIHRDVKSENVFVKYVDDDSTRAQLKLSDFGLAKYEASGTDHTAETGSYRWMAPEVIRHEAYDKSCDVYSLSMVFYEMLTFTVPFSCLTPVQAAFAVANDARRPPLPPLPPPVEALIAACWEQRACQRPSAAEVLQSLQAFATSNLSFASVQMGTRLLRSASAHAALCTREA